MVWMESKIIIIFVVRHIVAIQQTNREFRILENPLHLLVFSVSRKLRKDSVHHELFTMAISDNATADFFRNFVDREYEEVNESATTTTPYGGATRRSATAKLGGIQDEINRSSKVFLS